MPRHLRLGVKRRGVATQHKTPRHACGMVHVTELLLDGMRVLGGAQIGRIGLAVLYQGTCNRWQRTLSIWPCASSFNHRHHRWLLHFVVRVEGSREAFHALAR